MAGTFSKKINTYAKYTHIHYPGNYNPFPEVMATYKSMGKTIGPNSDYDIFKQIVFYFVA